MENLKRYNVHYAVIQFLYWGMFAAYYAFGTPFLYGLGLNNGQTGLVLAGIGLLSVAVQPLVAYIADRAKVAKTKALALFVSIPACILLIFVWLLPKAGFLTVAFYGVAWMLLITLQFLISSFGMEYQSAGIPLHFGMGRAVGSLGYALLAYGLGLAAARLGTGVTLPFGAVTCLLLICALALWKSVPKPEKAEEAAVVGESPGKTAGFFKRYPRFGLFVAGSTLSMVAYCMGTNFLVRIVEHLGGGTAELGIAVMIAALSEIPTIFFSGKLRDRFGSGKLMVFTALMLTLKATLICIAPDIGFLYVAMLSQMLSYSLFVPVTVYYADALMAPGDRVRGQAMMTLVPTLGTSLGSLIGGFLLERIGVNGMLVFCVVCSAVGATVMILGTNKQVR